MKWVFVDTGAWYALVDRTDPDHSLALPCFQQYQDRLVTSNFVFDETLTLLRYRLGWRVAHTFGEQLRSSALTRTIRVTLADENAAWQIFTRYQDKSFSFTDCTSFSVMARLKIDTAIAIDNDFRAYGLRCLP